MRSYLLLAVRLLLLLAVLLLLLAVLLLLQLSAARSAAARYVVVAAARLTLPHWEEITPSWPWGDPVANLSSLGQPPDQGPITPPFGNPPWEDG